MMECRHFGECGSCRNYEGGYEAQLERKRLKITEQFSNFYTGAIDVCRSPESHYRARAEFKVWHAGDRSHLAMNRADKNGALLIEECPKVIEPIETLMFRLLRRLREEQMTHKLFGMDFLSSEMGDDMVVSLLYHRKLDEEWKVQAQQLAEEFDIDVIGRSRKQKEVIGRDYVEEVLDIGGRTYRFRQIENSFTQPNPAVNEQMVSWALSQMEGISGDLLELYCGAGNFTIPFASKFEKVLATEISKASINAAKENMQLNDVHNIDFVRMSAEEFVQALDGVREFTRMKDIDLKSYELKTLFVDPPRSGMDEESCRFASRFEHLVYISCNPDTLHRDLEFLSRTHEATAMGMFDQFPYTDHLEMGVKLRKRAQ